MIYIPFFIVILIDKRGVREAERGGKRERTVRTHNDIHNERGYRAQPYPASQRAPPPHHRAHRCKRAHPHERAPSTAKRGMHPAIDKRGMRHHTESTHRHTEHPAKKRYDTTAEKRYGSTTPPHHTAREKEGCPHTAHCQHLRHTTVTQPHTTAHTAPHHTTAHRVQEVHRRLKERTHACTRLHTRLHTRTGAHAQARAHRRAHRRARTHGRAPARPG